MGTRRKTSLDAKVAKVVKGSARRGRSERQSLKRKRGNGLVFSRLPDRVASLCTYHSTRAADRS